METSSVILGIKHSMVAQGMYQRTVAERAGFTEQQFSDMLNGRKTIKAEYLPAIAKALEVTPNDLFGIQGSQPSSADTA